MHGTRPGVSYLINYGTLLQNATDMITKYDSYFITKCDKSLLQNASGFLLQNATVLLQNATVITKYNVYYILRQYIVVTLDPNTHRTSDDTDNDHTQLEEFYEYTRTYFEDKVLFLP